MAYKYRYFKIHDVGCISQVSISSTAKEIFDYMDEYLENIQSVQGFDPSDDSFDILYKDGSTDCVNSDYDGHYIKRRNIASFVWTNACDSVVYGGWAINEHGVVTPSGTVQIADFGITEVEEPVSLV